MDYYLCYVSYVLIVVDNNVFDEWVLQGLWEIYNFLGVFIGFMVWGIQIMKEMIEVMVEDFSLNSIDFIVFFFDYMIRELSEFFVQ